MLRGRQAGSGARNGTRLVKAVGLVPLNCPILYLRNRWIGGLKRLRAG
jgi:hypothetical protein